MTVSDLTRYLPRHTAEYAGVLSLGLIAGAALMLLLAPKARRELREKVSVRVGGLREAAKNMRLVNGHAEERTDSPT